MRFNGLVFHAWCHINCHNLLTQQTNQMLVIQFPPNISQQVATPSKTWSTRDSDRIRFVAQSQPFNLGNRHGIVWSRPFWFANSQLIRLFINHSTKYSSMREITSIKIQRQNQYFFRTLAKLYLTSLNVNLIHFEHKTEWLWWVPLYELRTFSRAMVTFKPYICSSRYDPIAFNSMKYLSAVSNYVCICIMQLIEPLGFWLEIR